MSIVAVWNRPRWICAVIVLFAFAVRCHRLGEVNYWFDETFSLRMAEFPVPELISRCALDTHPPLYFLCVKAWSFLFGQTPWMARMMSVVWSVAAVACGFGFVYEALSSRDESRADGNRPALAASLAALLLALSPLELTWAHQVRMYAPLECLSILSTWLLWRSIQKPGSNGRWICFAIVELVGLYMHVTMLFLAAGHFVGIFLVAWRAARLDSFRSARNLFLCGMISMGIAGLGYFPWFLIARSQQARVQGDFWSEPFEWRLLGEAIVRCFGNPEAVHVNDQAGFWIGQGLVLLLLVQAVGRRSFDLLVSASAAAPFAALIAASILGRNILHCRYFISGYTLVCLSAAVVASRIPSRTGRTATVAGLLIAQSVLTWVYFGWRVDAAAQPGLPGVVRLWEEHRGADDLLIFSNPMSFTTARFYSSDALRFRVFGDQGRYTFFVGTAIMSDGEYISSAEIDASDWQSVWICDFGLVNRFMQPAVLSDAWALAAEEVVPEFNGTLILRRYDRPIAAPQSPTRIDSAATHR